MTAYTTISNALVQVGAKPFATTVQALRDNPLAIAEADATVPLNLLPTVLLGTVGSASGTSSTISSLVLTPYKLLLISYTFTATVAAASWTLSLGSGTVATGSSGQTTSGLIIVDLGNGRSGNIAAGATPTGSALSGYSTATTSVGFSLTGSTPSFTAGSWRLYGLK